MGLAFRNIPHPEVTSIMVINIKHQKSGLTIQIDEATVEILSHKPHLLLTTHSSQFTHPAPASISANCRSIAHSAPFQSMQA
jgi:hypothetical protein